MAIRAGFIGTGGISSVHLKYLKSRKDVEIKALCDVDEKALEKRRAEFGGAAFRDYEKMLAETQLDAVWICTPTTVRRGPLVACAKRAIPVFCEKPVERYVEQGAKIADELRKLKARVQVGYVFRAMPAIRELRKAMADDAIHAFQSVYICNVGLTKKISAWFYDKERSGGALLDQATHNLDILRYLLGDVREVQGLAANPVTAKAPGYTIDEVISLGLIFKSGAVGSHVHNCVGDAWRNYVLLSGEKRVYRIKLNGGELEITGAASASVDLWDQSAAPGKAKVFRQDSARDIYSYENEAFLEQVKTGDWSRNPCDCDDGLASLKLTLACDRAVTEGNRITL